MDSIGARGQRTPAQDGIVVLPDGKDRSPGGVRQGDRRDAIVAARREIDDDPLDVGQGALERGRRPDGHVHATRATHELGQACRPDQVIGQDGDAHGQPSISARWWKTSRAVTTPVGRPSSMIGMCRNPPTAILWMAMAIGSS